jgi:ABC-type nitrate/sulfonate/bicarbonate transport system substrate-binding protein
MHMSNTRQQVLQSVIALATLAALTFSSVRVEAQQKDLGEVTILTAVSNMAFSAVWVAEQLKYFEQEGVRAKITPAAGGAPCQNAVVGRSAHLCASSSEGLVLAQIEGAPLIAIQAHNRNLTLSIAVRKAITDKFKVTRKSPLNDRIKVLTELGTIGATSPGAVSEQIFKFLVPKVKGDPGKLKFAYLGGTELPAALMNNVVDALAQSPPSAEITEAAGKGYVLLPLGPRRSGGTHELSSRSSDGDRIGPSRTRLLQPVRHARSHGPAPFITAIQAAFKAALRAHRSSDKWGNMNQEGWQKL